MPVSSYFGAACCLLLAASVAWGIYWSMDWMFYADAPVMQYIAWRILDGAVPYRDIYEADMPGAYLLHMLCLRLFGGDDLAFRLFDLAFSALAASAILLLGWRRSKLYAATGALLFVAYHLSWGAVSMGERDFLMVPFLLFAAYCFREFLENPSRLRLLFLFGLLVGMASCIKPIAALFALLCVLGALWPLASAPGKVRMLALAGAGFVAPLALVALWLFSLGALQPFYAMLTEFLPFYAQQERISVEYRVMFLLVNGYCFAMGALIAWRMAQVRRSDMVILGAGLLYGILHFYIQGKGMWYHLYPLRAFWCVYVALVIPSLRARFMEQLFVLLVVAGVCLHFSFLQELSQQKLTTYHPWFSADYLRTGASDADEALASVPAPVREAYLAAHPHQGIQFLGLPTNGFWNVAYRQRWVLPTRYTYPFVLCPRSWNELSALKDAMYRDLNAVRPLVVLVDADSWPFLDGAVYRSLDMRSPWKEFFPAHYRLTKETRKYRVYARTD